QQDKEWQVIPTAKDLPLEHPAEQDEAAQDGDRIGEDGRIEGPSSSDDIAGGGNADQQVNQVARLVLVRRWLVDLEHSVRRRARIIGVEPEQPMQLQHAQ